MFGWPVKAGCKVCFRTGPMWLWFILSQFVCEQALNGWGGYKVTGSLKKNPSPPLSSPHPPPLMFTPPYRTSSDHPRRKEEISLGVVVVVVGGVVCVRVKAGGRGVGGDAAE